MHHPDRGDGEWKELSHVIVEDIPSLIQMLADQFEVDTKKFNVDLIPKNVGADIQNVNAIVGYAKQNIFILHCLLK